MLGLEPQVANWRTRRGNLCFAMDYAPVFQFGDQAHIVDGCRKYVTFAGQHFR